MLLFWLACSSPAPQVPAPSEAPEVQAVGPKVVDTLEPRFTQEQLADHPEAVTLEGYLICPKVEGPWTLAVYSAHPEFTGPKPGELPWMPPVTTAGIDKAGVFSLRTPKAEKLLLIAFQDGGAVQAFTDESGSYMPVESGIKELVLDCRFEPQWAGAAPTRMQGKQVAAKPKRSSGDDAWLYETTSAKRDLQHDYDTIEEGMEYYLDVLGDRPDAADLAASLAMMPDQDAAERIAREMQ
ncbi:MAG: hypothetical protein VX899_13005 [Myxococcota bacterium]|nr:hypothetical protein [Myxococcota bacterium]